MIKALNAVSRPARVVAVHLLGEPARAGADNAAKAGAVRAAVAAIADAGWPMLDAVVFPGGLFWLPTHVGPLEQAVRRRVIERAPVTAVMLRAAQRLAARSPGVALVGGVRTPASVGGRGDQLAVAWRRHGVVALGRKVWPSPAEIADPADSYLVSAADFGSRHRLLRLASGCTAVLCACYDMFGVGEVPGPVTARVGGIRLLLDRDAVLSAGDPGFPERRAAAVAAWHRLLRGHGVSVAVATVHGFRRPGREVYWQRHGVAVASAALGGGLAVAAAHFHDRLPDPSSGTLAAARVPRSHLAAGLHRWGWPLPPRAVLEGEGWQARLFVHGAGTRRTSRREGGARCEGNRRVIVPVGGVWDDVFDAPGIDVPDRDQPALPEREPF